MKKAVKAKLEKESKAPKKKETYLCLGGVTSITFPLLINHADSGEKPEE